MNILFCTVFHRSKLRRRNKSIVQNTTVPYLLSSSMTRTSLGSLLRCYLLWPLCFWNLFMSSLKIAISHSWIYIYRLRLYGNILATFFKSLRSVSVRFSIRISIRNWNWIRSSNSYTAFLTDDAFGRNGLNDIERYTAITTRN